MPLTGRRRFWYARYHRRLLRLRSPQLFSEKVNWRIAFDRRTDLAFTCDKLKMKAYAERVAGDVVRIPKTFWSGTDLDALASVDLPERWVLKPTHRSGQVVLGQGRPDIENLRVHTAGWLGEWHWQMLGEWAYGQATPQLLAEELIGGLEQSPNDYKVFVFDGVPQAIQVDSDRFSGHRRRFYDVSWRPLDVRNIYPLGPVHERPARLDVMLDAAARLGASFDFMRIDLYHVSGQVWFGETSPYPGGGLEPFFPHAFDVELGSWWKLPALGGASIRLASSEVCH
jgi:hypothetical protein